MQVPVDPCEAAVDLVIAADGVNLSDRSQTGIPDCLGMRASQTVGEVGQPHVRYHRQMCGCVSGVDFCAPSALKHDDGMAAARYQVSRRQAGDPSADDGDIDLDIAG